MGNAQEVFSFTLAGFACRSVAILGSSGNAQEVFGFTFAGFACRSAGIFGSTAKAQEVFGFVAVVLASDCADATLPKRQSVKTIPMICFTFIILRFKSVKKEYCRRLAAVLFIFYFAKTIALLATTCPSITNE